MSIISTRILFNAFAIAFALIHAVAAAPTTSNDFVDWKAAQAKGEPYSTAPGSFSIDQVEIPNWSPRPINYTKLYVNTLRKYKNPIPEAFYGDIHSRDLNLKERQTTISLTGANVDGKWAYHIYLGTPQQRLYVWFDTGSPDLWVFSDALPASETSNHIVYSASKSSTSQLMAGQSFDIVYGAGEVSGNVHNDILTLDSFSISGYPLETATEVAESFYDASGIDGIFGCDMSAYQIQGPTIEPTWMAFVNAYVGITLFTVNHHYTGGGTWTFGTIDSTQYTNSISYSTAYHPDYDNLWTINATSYSVGSFTPTTLSLPIILDTGSYVTVLPASVCAAYWAKVTGAELYNGNYVFPCTSTLPDFHIKITGGYNATIHGAYWNLGSISGGVPSSAYCYGGLQPTTGLSVFGATFFESLFVVFDYGGSRIGLATKTLP